MCPFFPLNFFCNSNNVLFLSHIQRLKLLDAAVPSLSPRLGPFPACPSLLSPCLPSFPVKQLSNKGHYCWKKSMEKNKLFLSSCRCVTWHCKAKQFHCKLETKVVKCSISAPEHFREVSALRMCLTKIGVFKFFFLLLLLFFLIS